MTQKQKYVNVNYFGSFCKPQENTLFLMRDEL
jgi:hypothetical protein